MMGLLSMVGWQFTVDDLICTQIVCEIGPLRLTDQVQQGMQKGRVNNFAGTL